MPRSKSKTKTANLLTVGQMIDSAFGHVDVNVVNFKMLQTVLVLLARQLRLLNRQVAVESDSPIPTSDPNIVISEIRIKRPSKKKSIEAKPSKPYDGPGSRLSKSDRLLAESLPAKLSMREFEQPSTAWSSGVNSPGHSALDSVMSEATLRNQQYYNLLERIEEQRERVLRVINQRRNSRDAGVTSPSPMTSMANTEVEYEKLIVVENMLAERETRKCLPLVTRDVFDELVQTVRDLQKRLDDGNVGGAEFPENIKLMQDLRKGASLTEAMAALQISARIEAAEKAIQRVTSLVEDTGLQRKAAKKQPEMSDMSVGTLETENQKTTADFLPSAISRQYVTKEELQVCLDTKQADIISRVNVAIKKMSAYIEENTKQARKLEVKLGDALNMKEKFQEMEAKLISNTHQLNNIDTGLTSQMTNLQEQLTQVQLDLETGLENMNETLANKGADTELLTDLNRNFQNLQIDIERTGAVQKELNDNQKRLAFDIDRLKYDVELLRDIKCDREEVIDALRDKAGIKDLNGMVANARFEASLGDFEKSINDAFTIFRKQETVWQKAINDIFRRIDDKVDMHHLQGLREDTCNNLNKLKRQVDCIKKILGEPLAASVSRRIYRDTSCLLCANPAHIMPPEDSAPILPPLRPPAVGAEAEMNDPNKEGTVLPACITGLKIPHPIDPRAQICTRYCGGSHTKKRSGATRKASSLRLQGKPLRKRDIIETMGYDGKIYQVEDEVIEQPCIPCNQEYGAGEGSLQGLPIDARKTSSGKFITPGQCQCGKENEASSIPRCSFTPSVPPMMDQLSGMPSVSAQSILF